MLVLNTGYIRGDVTDAIGSSGTGSFHQAPNVADGVAPQFQFSP
jgi:hypothetical protein